MSSQPEEAKTTGELIKQAIRECETKNLKESKAIQELILKDPRFKNLYEALAQKSTSKEPNPVFQAISLKAHTSFIQALLQLGKDHPKAKGYIYNYYIEQDKAPSLGNISLLQHAILMGDLSTIHFLSKNLIKNPLTDTEKTRIEQKSIIEKALHEAINEKGVTCLHLLARRGSKLKLEYFMNLGINLNVIDWKGRTLYHYAVLGGQKDLIAWMLIQDNLKPIVNAINKKGRTPLHTAAMRGQTEIVNLLIQSNPEQVYKHDSKGETPLALAYRRARRFPTDHFGDSLPTVHLLREAMNNDLRAFWDNPIAGNPLIKARFPALSRVSTEPKSLSEKQRIFRNTFSILSDLFQRTDSTRSDLVSGMIIPVLELEGSIKLHRVNILNEEEGVFAVALEPLESSRVFGKPVRNVKVAFYSPKDVGSMMQQIDSPATERHVGHITHNLKNLLARVKHDNPKEDLSVSFMGQGLGGMDAQNAAFGLMKTLEHESFSLQDLSVVLLNSPGINPEVVSQSQVLAEKLKSNHKIKRIERHRLQVDGSYIPLFGQDKPIFGRESKILDETNEISLRDQKLHDEISNTAALSRGSLPVISASQERLDDIQQAYNEISTDIANRRKLEKERAKSSALLHYTAKFIDGTLTTVGLKKSMSDLLDEQQILANMMQHELMHLYKLRSEFFALRKRLYDAIGSCYNLEPNFEPPQTDLPATLKAAELESVWSVTLGREHDISDDRNRAFVIPANPYRCATFDRASNIFSVHEAPSVPLVPAFKRKMTELDIKVRKETAKEELIAIEAQLMKELSGNDATFKKMFDRVKSYKRDKGPAFENIYASGEYLFHDVAYENFEEGDIVPVLDDDGVTIRPYRVHPVVGNRGLVSIILTPMVGGGDIKFLFRGTHDIHSAERDFSRGGAGYETFKARMPGLLGVVNEVLKNERQRLREEGRSEQLTFSIGGHSLGGADAQYFSVLMLSAMAQNRFDKLKTASELKEDKEGKEGKEMEETEKLREFLLEIDRIPPQLRDHIEGVKLRLQTYNAPGIDERTAKEGLALAKFLRRSRAIDSKLPEITLEAFYQRVNLDPVHTAGRTHLFAFDCGSEIVDLDILKFTDYWNALKAHTDKQFNGSARPPQPLAANCYTRLHNAATGKPQEHEAEFTYIEKGTAPYEAMVDVLKKFAGSAIASRVAGPERGPGDRPNRW